MLYRTLSNAAHCLRFMVVLLLLCSGTVHAAPYAYIPNGVTDDISVIDIATDIVVATVLVGISPCGIAVNANGTQAYVVNFGDNDISVIGPDTMAGRAVSRKLP